MPTPKKVVHIIPRFTTGGAEMLVLEYYRNLPAEKYQVYVASGVEDGEFRSRFTDPSRVFVASRQKQGGRFGAWSALRTFLSELKPDLVHTHLVSSDLFGFWYKRFSCLQTPWVVTLHNVESHASWARRQLWKFLLPRATRVIAVSPEVARYATEHLNVPAKKIQTILNGINLAPWLAVSTASLLQGPTIRLATIGRLEEQKGHCFLLTALSKLQNYKWELEVFGDGELKTKLEQQAQALGINSRIRWNGVVNDLPKRLTEVDVVVQPSRWEGLSLVIMEAMAAGRLVVASSAAAAGLITSGTTGYVVPTENSAALEVQLETIFKNPTIGLPLAQAARAFAEDHFSLKRHLDEIDALYQHLL